MCNGPARAKTHSKVERTLVVEDDTKQKIETYCDGMQKVYAGVQDIYLPIMLHSLQRWPQIIR